MTRSAPRLFAGRLRRWALCLAAHALLAPSGAGAVIVSAGAGDSKPPTPDPGIAHVAIVAGLSGVYVGKGWLLTAGHVLTAARNQKKTEVLLGDQRYQLRPETAVPLTGKHGKTDLALVRIDGDPGLPVLEIATRTPPVGTYLILAGNGPLQETARTCWDASGHAVPESAPGARCGFLWRKTPEGRTNGLQWGTNQVDARDALLPGPGGVRTRVFSTVFRKGLPTAREAQAGVGDSGGPVFASSGGGFELAGILLSVSAQRQAAALFGDRTLAADLSVYRDQILGVLARE